MKKKEIILKRGMAKEIAETLKVTPMTVYKALRWRTNGKKSIAVRRLAEAKMREFYQ
jgi:DNA invertase Pin-like site-specific DNA recombinase